METITVHVQATTPKGNLALRKIYEDTNTDDPDNELTLRNVMKSTKLTAREKRKMFRNMAEMVAARRQYKLVKTSDDPFTIQYSNNVFNGVGIFVFAEFVKKIRAVLHNQNVSDKDYIIVEMEEEYEDME